MRCSTCLRAVGLRKIITGEPGDVEESLVVWLESMPPVRWSDVQEP